MGNTGVPQRHDIYTHQPVQKPTFSIGENLHFEIDIYSVLFSGGETIPPIAFKAITGHFYPRKAGFRLTKKER